MAFKTELSSIKTTPSLSLSVSGRKLVKSTGTASSLQSLLEENWSAFEESVSEKYEYPATMEMGMIRLISGSIVTHESWAGI